MKKYYIVPTISITLCCLELSFLAGSDSTRDTGTELGPNGSLVKQPTIPVAGDNEEVTVGSKGFDAWSTWDD